MSIVIFVFYIAEKSYAISSFLRYFQLPKSTKSLKTLSFKTILNDKNIFTSNHVFCIFSVLQCVSWYTLEDGIVCEQIIFSTDIRSFLQKELNYLILWNICMVQNAII